MAKIIGLTEDDVQVLRAMARILRNRPHNTRGRLWTPDQPVQAPDVYIAIVPEGGIAGRSGLVVSSAECQIYRLLAGLLTRAGFTRLVHNLSSDAIPAGLVAIVERDKFGTWWAVDMPDASEPDSGMTGTGTFGEQVCDPIIIQETDIRCELNPSSTGTGPDDYRLVQYRRSVSLDFVGGCLERTVGDWIQVRVIGCCDPTCVEDPIDQKFWYCLGDPVGGSVEAPCQSYNFTNAVATVTETTGDCSCLPSTLTRIGQGADSWTFTDSACGGDSVFLSMTCSGDNYLVVETNGTVEITSFNASPWTMTVVVTWGGPGGPCTGSATIVITD